MKRLIQLLYIRALDSLFLRGLLLYGMKIFLPKHLNRYSTSIYLNPRDPVISMALLFYIYERAEISFFQSKIKPYMTIVDVGANVGLYSGLALASKEFNGQIIAIEPHKESFFFLEKTVEANWISGSHNEVITLNCALSNKTSTETLYTNPLNKGDNRIYQDNGLENGQIIETQTLDQIIAMHQIQCIDILKIDVQGMEAKVIEGAKEIIGRSEHCILISEFWPKGLEKAGSDPYNFIKLLKGLGFDLFELGKGGKLYRIKESQIVQKNKGNKYQNLIGLKGKYNHTTDQTISED